MSKFFLDYPVFLLFAPPVWLWMLWYFSSLAFEMGKIIAESNENDELDINVIRKAWRSFSHSIILFCFSCAANGALTIYWWSNNYSAPLFLSMIIPGLIFVAFSTKKEKQYLSFIHEIVQRKL